MMLGKVFRCRTQEIADKFAKLCDKEELKWISGGSLIGKTHWDNYCEETCYSITNSGEVYYGDKRCYVEKEGRKDIIEFK